MDISDPVLACGDPDSQVEEQAGKPAAGRDAHCRDGDEQDERADEEKLVELMDSQRPDPFVLIACRIVPPEARGLWILRYLT
ncbi:hypothetical protein GCM10020367_27530 [Streptomyces sannanensis]|uniref:Uncharacterized protein n=1 Tax=Streptomyces sannanensis TaxID=285536 RepID=A0ABP6SBB8_9ACTN